MANTPNYSSPTFKYLIQCIRVYKKYRMVAVLGACHQ